ncbi:hypothetical protein CABS01_00270 [Colletotrichum abscissum]|nr:uncharacterized protein CABS01_00270 [Colletotrichum abscissum]KAK1525181.1 hypothetical protein CABS01_00270 [Colletotrichum abscissum]
MKRAAETMPGAVLKMERRKRASLEEEEEDWRRLGEERRGTRGRLGGHFRRREFRLSSHCGNIFFQDQSQSQRARGTGGYPFCSGSWDETRTWWPPGYRPELDKGSDLSTANHNPGRRPLPTRRQDQGGG